jgi:hypothetical protein
MTPSAIVLAVLHVLLWLALAGVSWLAWQAADIDWALGVAVGGIGRVGVTSIAATVAFALTPQDGA